MHRLIGMKYLACGILAGACLMVSGCGDGQRIEELTQENKALQDKVDELKRENALDREALQAKQTKIENLEVLLEKARAQAAKPDADKTKKDDKAKKTTTTGKTTGKSTSTKYSSTSSKSLPHAKKPPAPPMPPVSEPIGD